MAVDFTIQKADVQLRCWSRDGLTIGLIIKASCKPAEKKQNFNAA
jgi:hypothetical protein